MNNQFSPGLLSRLPEPPRKVAIVRASGVGEFICATPAFRALRMELRQAEISLIAMPLVEELAVRSPHLDRFIPFPGFPGMTEQAFDARKTVEFFQQMQAENFDLAIQMHGSEVYANLFTLMLGAKTTAGFIQQGDAAEKLDAAIPMPQQTHEVLRVLTLAAFLGASPQAANTEFHLFGEDNLAAETLLAQAQPPLIGIHPSAEQATQRWFPENFIAVGKELQQKYGGTVIVIGEKEDWQLAEMVAQKIGGATLNLAGKTSLPVLGAVIARLAILVTNDSGPAHVAYALSTPSVTVFGGTDPNVSGPLARPTHRVLFHKILCHPCGYSDCPVGYTCLEGVTAQQVLETAEQVIRC